MYESRFGHYEHKYDWNFLMGFGDNIAEKPKSSYKIPREIVDFLLYIISVAAFVIFYFVA